MKFDGFEMWPSWRRKGATEEELRRVGEILERAGGGGFVRLLPKYRELDVTMDEARPAGMAVWVAEGWVRKELAREMETLAGFSRRGEEELLPGEMVQVNVDCIEERVAGMGPHYGFHGYALTMLVWVEKGEIWDERGEVAEM
ncbi:MAG TPA: hypothetical protein VH253_03580 [Phycisphaerae bacterium]|nr:hypothetical protein [Phycisphaerae bacterium]